MRSAQQSQDGLVVESLPCPPVMEQSYDEYVESCRRGHDREVAAALREGFRMEAAGTVDRRVLAREDYERRKAYDGFECVRITYLSDGLRVVGFVWKPADTAGRKLPLIVFNRGGNRELGKLTAAYRFGFHDFLAGGFVVMASQYRGNDGGEGREEFGGADVRDVINLLPAARGLGYVDMNNVFMLGESRGAMMAYLALKHGMAVNAVAVIGGVSDLIADSKVRPELLDVAHRQLIPAFDADPEARMRERSALYWPESIDAPLLIMHGGRDWRCDPASQCLPLAQKLQRLKKTYELVIYAQDDHFLSLNREDSDRRIVAWFRRFMK
jgi:dipeptidyl aminopeptidase/acylaminoacyl peptidase